MNRFVMLITAAIVGLGIHTMAHAQSPHLFWVYVGTNTPQSGLSLFKLDTNTGTLTSEGMAVSSNAPVFFAIAPNQKFLYASVNRAQTGKEAGVQAFSIDAKTGKLTSLNDLPANGEETTFVAVDPPGKNVLTAHYSVATISVLPIDRDGKVTRMSDTHKQVGTSIDPERQSAPHAHSINTDPAGKFAFVCDLGADKIFAYRLDSTAGKLAPNDPPSFSVAPGAGPRHLTFHPNGKWVYVVTEMAGTVIGYNYDAAGGKLAEMQTIKTLPNDFKGTNTSSEVQIDPSGRFLYASNRGDSDFLTIYTIDQQSGKLTLVGYQPSGGKTPRNFRIDPTGKFLIAANQTSGNIVLFKIDQSSGKLSQIGTPLETKAPSCVKFLAVEGQ